MTVLARYDKNSKAAKAHREAVEQAAALELAKVRGIVNQDRLASLKIGLNLVTEQYQVALAQATKDGSCSLIEIMSWDMVRLEIEQAIFDQTQLIYGG